MIRRWTFAWFAAAAFLLHTAVSPAGRIPEGRQLERAWKRYLSEEGRSKPLWRYPYASCFAAASERYDLPLTLLLAVARGESFFDPKAVSDRNCHGIMQIQWPGTAGDLGITRLEELYDPCINISAGAAYLRRLFDRYDQNPHLALAAYNYGPGRIKEGVRAEAIPEGAGWYSGYIYHHLRWVLSGGRDEERLEGGGASHQGERRLAVISFHQPYRAAAFLEYVQERAPAVSLDWFRVGLGRYQVVLLYGNDRQLAQGKRALGGLGLRVEQTLTLH